MLTGLQQSVDSALRLNKATNRNKSGSFSFLIKTAPCRWEWDAQVMDKAIDLHNRCLRKLLEELGGHEIRNEGDRCAQCYN